MEICGHEIMDSEIVGIGPLMATFTDDQTMRQLYKRQRLSFSVHLRHQSILIESNWLDFGQIDDESLKKNKTAWSNFQAKYDQAKVTLQRTVLQSD